jgi:hypothetical protein
MKRLPGSKRYPSGLEWTLFRKLPIILVVGLLGIACFMLLVKYGLLGLDLKQTEQAYYVGIGLILLHCQIVFTAGLVCFIVMVMKGHAYVADAYPLPDENPPG